MRKPVYARSKKQRYRLAYNINGVLDILCQTLLASANFGVARLETPLTGFLVSKLINAVVNLWTFLYQSLSCCKQNSV